MKTPLLLIGCLLLVSIASSAIAAQSPVESPTIQGTLHNDTTVLFTGKTSITAAFPGFPMSTLLNASIVEGMDAFTLLGAYTFTDLHTVIVAENIDISQASSLEELYLRYADHLTQYNDVTIKTDTGLFFLEYPAGGTIKVDKEAAFAVSSFFPVILNHTTIPFFLMETQTPVPLDFSGDFAILAQSDITATIRVQDQHGNNLWSGHSPHDYLIIQDQRFQITQQPPFSLFPLNPTDSTSQLLSYSVTPATPQSMNLPELLDSVSAQAKRFKDTNISPAFQMIQEFTTIITDAPFIANGAMFLGHTNDTIMIDHSPQPFHEYGFIRFHDLTVTYTQGNSGPTIQGTYSLVFLGDHFYTPQAKNDENGIVFPYGLLIVWIIAFAVVVYIKFFLDPQVDQERDTAIKWYSLGIHFVLLILGFFLLDWEVNTQFGTSALTSFMNQGISIITGLFFGLELLVWLFGYVLLAVPVRLIINSGLRVFHIGKGGRGIGAGIGDFSIWIFAVLYLLLFVNILISVFHLSSLFTTG